MTVRHGFRRAACGLAVVGALQLPALAATPTDEATQADRGRGTINLDPTPVKKLRRTP